MGSNDGSKVGDIDCPALLGVMEGSRLGTTDGFELDVGHTVGACVVRMGVFVGEDDGRDVGHTVGVKVGNNVGSEER